MKRKTCILIIFLAAVLLAACGSTASDTTSFSPDPSTSVSDESLSDASLAASDSNSETVSSQTDCTSASCDTSSSFPASLTEDSVSSSESSSPENAASDTDEPVLQFYDSFRDIPFVELDYEVLNAKIDKNRLTQNGESWCALPGMMTFGDRCITDGTRIWFQVYEYPGEGFDWYQLCFDHYHMDDPGWIGLSESYQGMETPTHNRLYTHAEGYTIFTDDGESFILEPCPYA